MSLIWDIIGDALRLSALAGFGIAGVLAVLIWKQNLRSRVSYIRLIVQAVASAALFYLFSKPIPYVFYLLLFPLTLFLGRLYCGWLCPFGFIMDAVAQLKRIFRKSYRTIPNKLNKSLHKLRFVLLLVFLMLPVLLWFLNPLESFDFAVIMLRALSGPFRSYTFLIDPMIPLLTPWASPFAFYSIYFNYPYAQNIVTYVGGEVGQILVVIFVGLTVAGSFLFRRVWCRFCPTGSSLAAVNRFKGFKWAPWFYVEKDEEKCRDCEVCQIACPMQVTELHEQKNGKIGSSMCILCARCVESCPQPDAITLKFAKKPLLKSRNSAGRLPKWLRRFILRS